MCDLVGIRATLRRDSRLVSVILRELGSRLEQSNPFISDWLTDLAADCLLRGPEMLTLLTRARAETDNQVIMIGGNE